LSSKLPLPSWPSRLLPQQRTVPSPSNAQECPYPACRDPGYVCQAVDLNWVTIRIGFAVAKLPEVIATPADSGAIGDRCTGVVWAGSDRDCVSDACDAGRRSVVAVPELDSSVFKQRVGNVKATRER